MDSFHLDTHPYTAYKPELFPIDEAISVVAPFWSDVYMTRGLGSVFYHVYSDTN